ncbi:IS21 family transposase [Sulfurovum sp.]|jgi:transposase|uniref:IS21 family transposase n=1 Tax=Sulfurovum sp. TaxID=1969726 RepID=UPI002A36E601|nr:IS21 family transposase [Sulfurovum sp.]MDY0401963.1 IS21 family transposase [Sulfurovum sp.]
MLKKGEVKMIHKMIKEGLSKSAIARKLGISRDTVAKYAKLPEGHVPVIKREPPGTTVDAYLPHIARMLEEAHRLDVQIPTSAIFQEIQKMGYKGSLRWMQEIIQRHSLRERVENEEPLVRFETDPGHQMQVDWVEFPKDGLSAFVATMGYSRTSYVEYVTDEKVDTLIKCHMNAFSYFGGVPKEGLYDNMKTVIIKRNAYGRGQHKFNEQFRDFAKHCGMELKVCKPYRAQTKGKVERFNHYLRYSFHNTFKVRLSMMGYKMTKENANAEVMDWLDFTANARIHQTTLQKPFALLAQEQLQLLPVPKPYHGIHPIKATQRSIAQEEKNKPKQRVHIPQRDLQSYDEFIPAALAYLYSYAMITGGAVWR